MRRSASEIINELEARIAKLEKEASFNTNSPIMLVHPGGDTDYLNLDDILHEVQKMYDMGYNVQVRGGQYKPVPWDVKSWKQSMDSVIFHVKGGKDTLAQTVRKSDLCKAMCEAGLFDKAIDAFLKKNLKTR